MSLKVLLYLKKAGDQNSSDLSWRIILQGKSASAINPDMDLVGNGSFSNFIAFYQKLLSTGFSGKYKPKRPEIIAILPGGFVTHTSVSVPTRNRTQMLQAIPFLVEEYVIGELDDMHIGVGGYTSDKKIRVGIVEKQLIKKWIDLFLEHKLQPSVIVSLPDLLPVGDHEAKIVFFNNEVIFKSNDFCIQISEDNLKNIFPVIPVDGIDSVIVYFNPRDKNSSTISRKIKMEIESEGITKVDLRDLSGDIFENDELFSNFLLKGAINLADTKSSTAFGRYADFFMPIAYVVVILAILQIFLNIASGFFFSKKSEFVMDKAKIHYQNLFGDEGGIDVKKQWESRLKSSLVFSSDKSFSSIFTIVMSEFLNKKNNFKMEEFRFDSDSGDLKINIQTDSVAALDALKAKLKEKAMVMDIVSANDNDGKIKASIVVKPL